MDTDGTQNQISGGESHTVIQAGTTGPIQNNNQITNAPQINGDNAKQRNTETVVNIATPGSVVGIQCGGDIVGSTVTVNSPTVDPRFSHSF